VITGWLPLQGLISRKANTWSVRHSLKREEVAMNDVPLPLSIAI
jgi:hypothetical protein